MSTHETNSGVTEAQIAFDLLEYLRENPGVCADLSIHAGHHPWVRWLPEEETYLQVESMGYGHVEAQHVSGEALVSTFADNPVDLCPLQDAEDTSSEGVTTLWERVENDDDRVTVLG